MLRIRIHIREPPPDFITRADTSRKKERAEGKEVSKILDKKCCWSWDGENGCAAHNIKMKFSARFSLLRFLQFFHSSFLLHSFRILSVKYKMFDCLICALAERSLNTRKSNDSVFMWMFRFADYKNTRFNDCKKLIEYSRLLWCWAFLFCSYD